MSTVTVSKNAMKWRSVKFCVFDIPNVSQPYPSRMTKLKEMPLPPHVQLVHSVICENPKHLQDYLNIIVGGGGEGVMLRQPDSLYAHGRSKTILKVKVHDPLTVSQFVQPFQDCEVRFLALNPSNHGLLCEQYVRLSELMNFQSKWLAVRCAMRRTNLQQSTCCREHTHGTAQWILELGKNSLSSLPSRAN